jgi:hypothetical protein
MEDFSDEFIESMNEAIAAIQIEYDQLQGEDNGSIQGNQRSGDGTITNRNSKEFKESNAGVQF